MSESRRNVLGQRGEELAARYLEKAGYRVIERNHRNRYGEIDIIAWARRGSGLFGAGRVLVFIEVKTRKNDRFSHPAEAVTTKKQLQISRVATEYLSRNNLTGVDARFDVVAVVIPEDGPACIELIPNAFELCGGL